MSETLEAIINEKLDAREKRGHDNACREHARSMYSIGMSIEQIALVTNASIETVTEWINNKGA